MEANLKTTEQLSEFVPVLTQERMAQRTGLRLGQVQYKVKKGLLPSYKIGRVKLVNLVRTKAQKISDGYISTLPSMTKQKFAQLVGVTEGQVQGWINKGYIPTVKDGKHRLINIRELCTECIKNGSLIIRTVSN